jgi:hypothetical protein
LRPPPEAELVEAGKLTMGQLAQAHRDRLETGKPVLDIIVERGWILAQEAARLREAYGIEAPPVPRRPASARTTAGDPGSSPRLPRRSATRSRSG